MQRFFYMFISFDFSRKTLNMAETAGIVIACVLFSAIILGVVYLLVGRFCAKRKLFLRICEKLMDLTGCIGIFFVFLRVKNCIFSKF